MELPTTTDIAMAEAIPPLQATAAPLDYARPDAKQGSMSLWFRMVITLGLIFIAAGLYVYGTKMRQDVWNRTVNIRYEGDVSNGFGWGHVANNVGLLHVYDLYRQGRITGPNGLDYTPLRLTVVYFWAKWARSTEPYTHYRSWSNDYGLTSFMLKLNMLAEAASAFLAFWLIRHWVIRMNDAQRSILDPAPPFRGVLQGMIGAALLWFNPCVIWDGHGFPQWDVWNLPFFIAAALLASTNWWFSAGVCVVIGAFFKGQILLVAPIFLIWPIFAGRFDAPLRFMAGFVFAGAMLAFPWMHVDLPGMRWYLAALVSLGLTVPFVMRLRVERWTPVRMKRVAPYANVGFILLAVCLCYPWTSTAPFQTKLYAPAVLAGVAAVRFLPLRLLPAFYALAVGLFIGLEMVLYNGSTAWYVQGFKYGTEKLMWMATRDTYNIPYLLETLFRWRGGVDGMVDVPMLGMVTIRDLMLYIYGVCLALCGIGAAISDRRNDVKFLAALVAPWLCWFVLLTQLNNRYMIWASALSGLLAGVGLGMSLLGVIVSLIGWCGIAQIMCWSVGPVLRGTDNPDVQLAALTRPLTPHLAWPLILAAAIYLYVAVVPRQLPRIKKPAAAS